MRAPESHRHSNLLLSRIAQGLLGFTLIAFAAKAIAEPAVQARYTPIVVLHATSMVAWLGLLASQAWLAAEHRFELHKTFGRASMALVGAMAVSGAIISVNIGRELGRPEVTVVNLAAFVTFLPLYFAALHFARRLDMHAHRQAMLIGTLALMTPAYARVVQVAGLPDPVAIAVQVPITLGIALGYERKVLGRVSQPVIGMLGFSLGVIAVMVGVLAVWFM
ncbi:MAG: hypothetical protein RIC51_11680 [Erythrobacter sp.]